MCPKCQICQTKCCVPGGFGNRQIWVFWHRKSPSGKSVCAGLVGSGHKRSLRDRAILCTHAVVVLRTILPVFFWRNLRNQGTDWDFSDLAVSKYICIFLKHERNCIQWKNILHWHREKRFARPPIFWKISHHGIETRKCKFYSKDFMHHQKLVVLSVSYLHVRKQWILPAVTFGLAEWIKKISM